MTIIIKTPQPDVEERLVLVPIADTTRERQAADPTAWRDATPEDLERAGLVLREQAAPGTLAHLRADLRDMAARAEKAELDAAEWAAEVDALRAEALAELADARRERDTLLAELADAKAECQGAMLSAYAQYAETVRERDEAKELARVLEVERDTLLAENAKLRGEVAEQRVLLRWFLDGDDHTHEDDCGARGSHDLDVCRAAPCLDDCEGPHCACGATEMRARALAALEAP